MNKLRPGHINYLFLVAIALSCLSSGFVHTAVAENVGPLYFIDSDADDQKRGDVAFNNVDGQYLIVWQDETKGAIMGEIRAANGAIVRDDFVIALKSVLKDNGLVNPAVAFKAGARQYLVVWNRLRPLESSIRGQLVHADGTLSGAEINVGPAGTSDIAREAAVAADRWGPGGGGTYLVVWPDDAGDLKAQGIDTAGGYIGSLLTVALNLFGPPADQPSVVWNAGTAQYLAVYHQSDVILARSVDPDTAYISPVLTLSETSTGQKPDVAWNEGKDDYLVVWVDSRNTAGEIWGQRLTGDAALSGGNFLIDPAYALYLSDEPSVAAEQEHYVVAYERTVLSGKSLISNIYMRSVGTTGPACMEEVVYSNSGYDDLNPAIASGIGEEFLVSWQHVVSGANSDIYGQRVRVRLLCNNPAITSTPVESAVVGELYTYDVNAYDPDGDPLTYSLEVSPSGMTINPSTGIIQWIPAGSDIGSHNVTVRVDDDTGGFVRQMYIISVSPDTLIFGFGESGDGLDYEITANVNLYTAIIDLGGGSFQISGNADVTLGPRTFTFLFTDLVADSTGSGFRILSGSVIITPSPPIEMATINPVNLMYVIHEITLNQLGAHPVISITLPDGTMMGDGVPPDPQVTLDLKGKRLTQGLDFIILYAGAELTGWYFRADDIPLKLIPTGQVEFRPYQVSIGASDLEYVFWSGIPDPDVLYVANHSYFSLAGWSVQSPVLLPDGLQARFSLDNIVALEEYETLFPFRGGFIPQTANLDVSANNISDGLMKDVDFRITYSQGSCGESEVFDTLSGRFGGAAVGRDGSVFSAEVQQDDTLISWGAYAVSRNRTDPVWLYLPGYLSWAEIRDRDGDGVNDLLDQCPFTPAGFLVDGAGCSSPETPGRTANRVEDHYNARMGGEDRIPGMANSGIYAGLNFLAGRTIIITIDGTAVEYPLNAVDGALFHLRYSGVTGITDAGSVESSLDVYGYAFHLDSFGLSYLNNVPGDSLVDGSVNLPWPSEFLLDFNSMRLCTCGDLDTAAIAQPAPPKNLGFWDTDFTPMGIVFQGDVSSDSCDGANTVHTLFVSMTNPIRHFNTNVSLLTPFDSTGEPGKNNDGSPGTIDIMSSSLIFDGFTFFPEEIRLSDWNGNDRATTESTMNYGYFELAGDTSLPHFGLRKMGIRPYRGRCPDGIYDPGRNGTCGEPPPTGICPDGRHPGPNGLCGDGDDFTLSNDDILSKVDVKDPSGFFGGPDGDLELIVEKAIEVAGMNLFTYRYGLDFKPPRRASVPAGMSMSSHDTEGSADGVFHSYEPSFEIKGILKLESSALITPSTVKMNYGFLADTAYYWTMRDGVDIYFEVRENLTDERLNEYRRDYDKAVNNIGWWAIGAGGLRGYIVAGLADILPSGEFLVEKVRDFRPDSWSEYDLGADDNPFPDITFKLAKLAGSATLVEGGEVWQEIYAESKLKTTTGFANFDNAFRMTRFVVDDGVSPHRLEIELKARDVPFEFMIAGESTNAKLIDVIIHWDGSRTIPITGLEGALVLSKLDYSSFKFKELGIGLGVGSDFFYWSGSGDASFSGYTLGGGIVVGKTPDLDPLRELDPDVASMLSISSFDGLYARLDGSYSIVNSGCALKIAVGAGIGGWYLNEGPIGGGKIKGYVYGKLLCVVNARGDIAMIGILGPDHHVFSGTGFVAGGIGMCEPEEWSTPAKVWDDDWCWTCLAYLVLQYIDSWDVEMDGECE